MHFHPLLFANITSWVHQDNHLLLPILHWNAIKPLQKKMAQQDDVVKRPKHRTMGKTMWKCAILACFILWFEERYSLLVASRRSDVFGWRHYFCLFSAPEAWVSKTHMLHICYDSCCFNCTLWKRAWKQVDGNTLSERERDRKRKINRFYEQKKKSIVINMHITKTITTHTIGSM